ncbi:hypothetical protein DSUL_50366 [Desulfovibrionales bacterium]
MANLAVRLRQILTKANLSSTGIILLSISSAILIKKFLE